jgi:2-amino-4-hydroxy-6-hydroxymethyldihydropteridine diphosphokinase
VIDIDILYFGELIIDEEALKVPHPAIAERRFTLVPLVELAADFVHPIHLKSQLQILKECKDQLPVNRLNIANG